MSDTTQIADSQGTTFTYGGVSFVAKSVKVKKSRALVDVTSLSAASGSTRVQQAAPLVDGDVITCEYWGTMAPTRGSKAAIVCSKLGISGDAFCEEFEETAQVGEMLIGNASFRITG